MALSYSLLSPPYSKATLRTSRISLAIASRTRPCTTRSLATSRHALFPGICPLPPRLRPSSYRLLARRNKKSPVIHAISVIAPNPLSLKRVRHFPTNAAPIQVGFLCRFGSSSQRDSAGALCLIGSALFSYLFWIESEYGERTRLSPSDYQSAAKHWRSFPQ
jgi:hypothetical protein